MFSGLKRAFKEAQSEARDYDYAVFHQPNGRFPRKAALDLGFTVDEIKQGLVVHRTREHVFCFNSDRTCLSFLDVAEPGARIL